MGVGVRGILILGALVFCMVHECLFRVKGKCVESTGAGIVGQRHMLQSG
jgi:hypothetical protein